MFKRISYNELNSRQQENYNFQKVVALLADYGFNCMWAPLKTSILVVWCVKSLSAILKYIKYSAVLENNFPASQQRLEVLRGTLSLHQFPKAHTQRAYDALRKPSRFYCTSSWRMLMICSKRERKRSARAIGLCCFGRI